MDTCFRNRSLETLESIRLQMASAEVSHWVAFAAMLVLNVAAWWYRGLTIAFAYFNNIIGVDSRESSLPQRDGIIRAADLRQAHPLRQGHPTKVP